MKTKKLLKKALKQPKVYTPDELSFFSRWLKYLKEEKGKKKESRKKNKGRGLPT